jgi:hypothetical protein
MKRLTRVSILCVLTSVLCVAGEWVGWITDRKCALSGQFTGDKHKACAEAGQPLVFVNEADRKIYTLSDHAKALDLIGQKVLVRGEMKGDAIEVRLVEPATR